MWKLLKVGITLFANSSRLVCTEVIGAPGGINIIVKSSTGTSAVRAWICLTASSGVTIVASPSDRICSWFSRCGHGLVSLPANHRE